MVLKCSGELPRHTPPTDPILLDLGHTPVRPSCLQTRLEERLATLDVELTAIKEYQDNSETYQQAVRSGLFSDAAGYMQRIDWYLLALSWGVVDASSTAVDQGIILVVGRYVHILRMPRASRIS